MKALTIWQPWASLIIAGAKPYEFRSWRFPRSLIGQRIVVHAAARKVRANEVLPIAVTLEQRHHWPEAAAETCLHPEPALRLLKQCHHDGIELPLAAGLGTAVLGEPLLGTRVAEQFGASRANDSDRDQHANWGWPLTDIEPWDMPIPMRGAQGFWNWPTPADAGLPESTNGEQA